MFEIRKSQPRIGSWIPKIFKIWKFLFSLIFNFPKNQNNRLIKKSNNCKYWLEQVFSFSILRCCSSGDSPKNIKSKYIESIKP